jgi:hypothetical protein
MNPLVLGFFNYLLFFCSITNKNLEFQNEHMGLILANCWLKFSNGSRVNFGFFNIYFSLVINGLFKYFL